MIPVSADVRANAGVKGGDEVEVEVTLDTDPRVVTIPDDLAVALEKSPVAKGKFDNLSNSKKKAYTLPIEAAKSPETRQRRIEKAIGELCS